jgi:hypothetical protein
MRNSGDLLCQKKGILAGNAAFSGMDSADHHGDHALIDVSAGWRTQYVKQCRNASFRELQHIQASASGNSFTFTA